MIRICTRLALVLLLLGCASDPPAAAPRPTEPPPRRSPSPAPQAAAAEPPPATAAPRLRPAAPERSDPFDPALLVEGNTLRVVLKGGRTMDGTFAALEDDQLVLAVPGGQVRLRRAKVERIEGRTPPPSLRGRYSLPPPEPPPPAFSFVRLPIDGRGLLPTLCWSADGASLLTVSRRGVVSMLRRGDFELQRRVELGRRALALDVSSRGPVVLLENPPALVLLDARTLSTQRTVPLSGRVTCLASAPTLAHAFVGGPFYESTLQVVDLIDEDVTEIQAGELPSAPNVKRHPDGIGLNSFEALRATPDGRYLFCLSSSAVSRLRIDETGELQLEETGPRIGQNWGRIEVSPDGRWVALPSADGNSP